MKTLINGRRFKKKTNGQFDCGAMAAPGRRALFIFLCFGVVLLAPPTLTAALAQQTLSVPWDEFRVLLRESIERQYKERPPKPPQPQVHALDSAVYHLEIKDNHIQGKIKLNGRVISGGPEPIALFDTSLVIDELQSVTGGHLLCRSETVADVGFRPDGAGPFQIEMSFLASVAEDHHQGLVEIGIPRVLNNAVYPGPALLARLMAAPGIKAEDGGFRFSSRDKLVLRLSKSDSEASPVAPKVDLYTILRWETGTLVMETFFWPRQLLPATYEIVTPEGFTLVSTSLPRENLSAPTDQRLRMTVSPTAKSPFSIIMARSETDETAIAPFTLPYLTGNRGQQGNYIIDQPYHRHIRVTMPETPVRPPLTDLPDDVQAVLGKTGFFSRMETGSPLTLALDKFHEISVPSVVLDTIGFFTAFEENGNQLAQLVLDVPAQVGSRLPVKPIANAQIWQLLVNGSPRNILSHDDGTWLIPLDPDQPSHVELALLIQGAKLGLEGRLETTIPQTTLPSRRLVVGIALPERVMLHALEGAVSSLDGDPPIPPTDFHTGALYYFSRAFYKGEGLPLTVVYKEPVEAPKP